MLFASCLLLMRHDAADSAMPPLIDVLPPLLRLQIRVTLRHDFAIHASYVAAAPYTALQDTLRHCRYR